MGDGGATFRGNRRGRSGGRVPEAVEVPGLLRELGPGCARPEVEPLHGAGRSRCRRDGKPSPGYSWGGWGTRTCATARARRCLSVYPRAPCARGHLRRNCFATRQPSAGRFCSAARPQPVAHVPSLNQAPLFPLSSRSPSPRGPVQQAARGRTVAWAARPGPALGHRLSFGFRVPLQPVLPPSILS